MENAGRSYAVERELRTDKELETFWQGFTQFKDKNPEETKTAREVLKFAFKDKEQLNREQFEAATEALTIFAYGASLARGLQIGTLKDKYAPEVQLRGGSKVTTKVNRNGYLYRLGLKKPEVGFMVGLQYIINPQGYGTETRNWGLSEKKTVSKHLVDRVVIDLLIAGVEEYAHSLYFRHKSERKLLPKFEQLEEILSKYEQMKKSGGFEESGKIYHTSDPEYRALVWKQKILRKYFPSLADYHKKFIDGVTELMHEKSD